MTTSPRLLALLLGGLSLGALSPAPGVAEPPYSPFRLYEVQVKVEIEYGLDEDDWEEQLDVDLYRRGVEGVILSLDDQPYFFGRFLRPLAARPGVQVFQFEGDEFVYADDFDGVVEFYGTGRVQKIRKFGRYRMNGRFYSEVVEGPWYGAEGKGKFVGWSR